MRPDGLTRSTRAVPRSPTSAAPEARKAIPQGTLSPSATTSSSTGVGFLGTDGVAVAAGVGVTVRDGEADGLADGEPAAVVGAAEGSVGAGSARQPSTVPSTTAVEPCRSARLVTLAAIVPP